MTSFPIQTAAEGYELAGTLTLTAPPAPPVAEPLRIGLHCIPADIQTDLRDYPGLRAYRHFGKDTGDADSLPELPDVKTDPVWLALAKFPNCRILLSWKDDVEQLESWLPTLDRDIWLTWYHEPNGNVDPARYRTTARRMVQIINASPNRHRILGNGPIVPRYWLVENGGDPQLFWYEGATYYGVDSYNDGQAYKIREMVDPAVALATRFGCDTLLGEWGAEQSIDDPSDELRAAATRSTVSYARTKPQVKAMMWWNKGGDRLTKAPTKPSLQGVINSQ